MSSCSLLLSTIQISAFELPPDQQVLRQAGPLPVISKLQSAHLDSFTDRPCQALQGVACALIPPCPAPLPHPAIYLRDKSLTQNRPGTYKFTGLPPLVRGLCCAGDSHSLSVGFCGANLDEHTLGTGGSSCSPPFATRSLISPSWQNVNRPCSRS